MSKKRWGMILVGIGVLRYAYENNTGGLNASANASSGLGSIVQTLDFSPGTLTYVIIGAGAYLWYKG